MENTPEIGRRIQAALSEEGLSQKRFAEMIGTAQSYMSDVCRGRRKPSLAIVDALASRLGYSTRWILHGEGAPKLAERGSEEPDRVYISDEKPLPLVAEPQGPVYGAQPTLSEAVGDDIAKNRAASHRAFQMMCAVAGMDPRPVAELHELLLEVVLRHPSPHVLGELKTHLRGMVMALPPPPVLPTLR